MLGKCNPPPALFTDCAARMRQDGRENMRLIMRADGAEGIVGGIAFQWSRRWRALLLMPRHGGSRDIAIARKCGGIWSIRESHPYYAPLAYALIHPRGERGWRYPIPLARGGRKVAPQKFALYRLVVRRDAVNATHRPGRLPHQYICDQRSKVAHRRIRFIRANQDQLRAASYRQITTPPQDAARGATLGKRVIHPSTFTGWHRQMSEVN